MLAATAVDRKEQMLHAVCHCLALLGHPRVGILHVDGKRVFYAYDNKGVYHESLDAIDMFRLIGECE